MNGPMPKQTIFLKHQFYSFSLLRIFDRIFDVIIDVVERLCLCNKYKSMFVNQKQDAYYVSMYITFFFLRIWPILCKRIWVNRYLNDFYWQFDNNGSNRTLHCGGPSEKNWSPDRRWKDGPKFKRKFKDIRRVLLVCHKNENFFVYVFWEGTRKQSYWSNSTVRTMNKVLGG